MSNAIDKLKLMIKSHPKLLTKIIMSQVSNDDLNLLTYAVTHPNLLLNSFLNNVEKNMQNTDKYDAEYIKQTVNNYNELEMDMGSTELKLESLTNKNSLIDEVTGIAENISKRYKLLPKIMKHQDNAMALAISQKASKQKKGKSDVYIKWVYEQIKSLKTNDSKTPYGKYTYNNSLNKTLFIKYYKPRLEKEFNITRSEKTIRLWLDKYFQLEQVKRLP